MQYQDFNLRLGFFDPAAGSYKVWVEGATPGGGSMRPEDAVQVSYDPKKFWNDPMRGLGGLVGDLDKRRGWTPERVYELGGLLADHALPEQGGVRGC
jgi:hypothetical protein